MNTKIGGSCVCLSSEKFKVISYRNKQKGEAIFEKGELKDYSSGKTTEENGTFVEFIPDKEVFSNGEIGFSFDKICADTKDISYLYSGITFIIKNDGTKEEKTFCAKNGIIDFVKDNVKKPLHKTIQYETASNETDSIEIAYQWGSKHEESYVFVNGLRCPEGGTPITGAKSSITKVVNNIAKQKFDGEKIRENLFYVINCKVDNPSFANQTKSKINNPSLRTLASVAFTSSLKKMSVEREDEFNSIVELLKKITKAEAAADRAREQILNSTNLVEKNQKKKVFSSDKLKDAEFLGQDSTLLIVEGETN